MASDSLTDADRTREDILAIATDEFANHGLSGARVDEIAARTRTSKRMIYYYFGGKEGLYQAVLERAYREIRSQESGADIAGLGPREALSRLVELTFDYDENHSKFVRLVSIENIHRAEYVAKMPAIRAVNRSAISTLDEILKRGQAAGVFRTGIDPLDLHLMISALCFFRVSNRHTFEVIFDVDFSSPRVRARHKQMITEAVLRFVDSNGARPRGPKGKTNSRQA